MVVVIVNLIFKTVIYKNKNLGVQVYDRSLDYSWDEIKNLLDGLYDENDLKVTAQEVLGQERYNGHLERHFERIRKYFEQLESW